MKMLSAQVTGTIMVWDDSFYDIMVLTIDLIINGVTLSPNPNLIKQYLYTLTITIQNGHNDLCT